MPLKKNRPDLLMQVVKAVADLKEPRGSTANSIFTCLNLAVKRSLRRTSGTPNFALEFRDALRRGVEAGILTHYASKYSLASKRSVAVASSDRNHGESSSTLNTPSTDAQNGAGQPKKRGRPKLITKENTFDLEQVNAESNVRGQPSGVTTGVTSSANGGPSANASTSVMEDPQQDGSSRRKLRRKSIPNVKSTSLPLLASTLKLLQSSPEHAQQPPEDAQASTSQTPQPRRSGRIRKSACRGVFHKYI